MGVVVERWCPTQQMLGVFLGDKSEETAFSWNYLAIDGDIRQCRTRARPHRSYRERQPMANERYRP